MKLGDLNMSSSQVVMIPIEDLRLLCLICGEWFKPDVGSHIFTDSRNKELELPICPVCFDSIAERGVETGNPAWVKFTRAHKRYER